MPGTVQQELARIIRRKKLGGQVGESLSPWNVSCLGRMPSARPISSAVGLQTAAPGTMVPPQRESASRIAPLPAIEKAQREVIPARQIADQMQSASAVAGPAPNLSSSAGSAISVFTLPKNISGQPVAPVPPPKGINTGAVAALDWNGLVQTLCTCDGCALCIGRKQVFPGTGCKQARVMFIGDWPLPSDDVQGRLFSGAPGTLLENIIKAMGLDAQSDSPDTGVYLTNVVKCRRPDDRNVAPIEACTCLAYLHRQIALIQPRVIVTLGGVPLRFLLNIKDAITKIRGTWQNYQGIPVMPTYHPAFLLRFENQAEAFKNEKRKVWTDIKAVMNYLNLNP